MDRHEDIGKGKIGLQAFQLLMNDPRLFDVAKILETPYQDDSLSDYERNIQLLNKMLTEKTKKLLHISDK